MSSHGNDDASSQPDSDRSNNKRQRRERENDVPPQQPILSSDLTLVVLLKLPVKSLIRFRCVCKEWKSMISDTQFTKSYLLNAKVDPTLSHHRLLLPSRTYNQDAASCSVKSLFNDSLTYPEDLDFALRYKYEVTGLCNGLVCLVANKYIRLWNPSMRLLSRKHPYLDVEDDEEGIIMSLRMLCVGFGYDHMNDNYKVVFVSCPPSDDDDEVEYEDDEDEDEHLPTSTAKVYSFGDDSWTIFENMIIYEPSNRLGKYVNGTLNWVAQRPRSVCPDEWVILSFDLGSDIFREVLLPDFGHDNATYPKQAVLKDHLSVYYEYEGSLVVWLMKEYGLKESWTKLMVIPYVVRSVRYEEPLCMSDDGEVLVSTTDGRTVVYDPKVGELKYPNIVDDKFRNEQYVYIESFVSPGF